MRVNRSSIVCCNGLFENNRRKVQGKFEEKFQRDNPHQIIRTHREKQPNFGRKFVGVLFTGLTFLLIVKGVGGDILIVLPALAFSTLKDKPNYSNQTCVSHSYAGKLSRSEGGRAQAKMLPPSVSAAPKLEARELKKNKRKKIYQAALNKYDIFEGTDQFCKETDKKELTKYKINFENRMIPEIDKTISKAKKNNVPAQIIVLENHSSCEHLLYERLTMLYTATTIKRINFEVPSYHRYLEISFDDYYKTLNMDSPAYISKSELAKLMTAKVLGFNAQAMEKDEYYNYADLYVKYIDIYTPLIRTYTYIHHITYPGTPISSTLFRQFLKTFPLPTISRVPCFDHRKRESAMIQRIFSDSNEGESAITIVGSFHFKGFKHLISKMQAQKVNEILFIKLTTAASDNEYLREKQFLYETHPYIFEPECYKKMIKDQKKLEEETYNPRSFMFMINGLV